MSNVQLSLLAGVDPSAVAAGSRVLLTQAQLAAAFGLAPSTISRWPLTPVDRRGREAFYCLREAIEHRIVDLGRLDLAQERALLARVQRERQELALQRERGELLEADDVQRVWEQYISNARARLLALPDTAAPRVVGLDVRTAALLLRELVFEALEELARYNPDHAGDQPASSQPDTPDPELWNQPRKRRRKRCPVEVDGITPDDGRAP